MYKTEEQAEELHPGAAAAGRRRWMAWTWRSACRSRTCGRWSTARGARAWRCMRRTCTGSRRARSRARCRRRCCASWTCAASCWATPSAAALFGETDRALALKVPAALEAGLAPILCVGETEEERDDGDTERKLRQQIKEDLANVPSERLAEVVIAYEPIWAIGTGRVATPEQAQEAIAFIRALVGDRVGQAARGGADPVRRLGQAGERAPSCWRWPDVDGALVGGASLEAESFARSWRRPRDERACRRGRRGPARPAGAVRVPDRARRLGHAPAGPGQRDLAGAHAGVRRAVGDLPAHDADGVRARGRPAGGADGQHRGRAPEPRRGRGRAPGPGAHRRRGRATGSLAQNAVLRAAFAGRRAGAPAGAGLRRRRALLARRTCAR